MVKKIKTEEKQTKQVKTKAKVETKKVKAKKETVVKKAEVKVPITPIIKKAVKKDALKLKVPKGFTYGTGKRKCSIAKVWLFGGKGQIAVNEQELKAYIKRDCLCDVVKSPLNKLSLLNKYDARISVMGGGLTGQASAIQLGLARALVKLNPEFRKVLKEDSLLSRDSRIKERKKYGKKKARKGYQFRKR